MRELFLHAITLSVEPLLTDSKKVLLLAKDEGKIRGFVEERRLRIHPLIEGNLYIVWGNMGTDKTFSVNSWELLQEFPLPYQKRLVHTFKKTVERYFPDGTGGYCFNLLLHTLRKTVDKRSLLINYAWLYSVVCIKEGMGLSDEELKSFLLYKETNKINLKTLIKTINRIRKDVLES